MVNGGAPDQLLDALARIDKAKQEYCNLAKDLNEFYYNFIDQIVCRKKTGDSSYTFELSDPRKVTIPRPTQVLVGQIVENLRSALDYMVFEMSKLNYPKLDEKIPEFIIVQKESAFDKAAKRSLKYLSDEQRRFVKAVQPFNGNCILSLINKIARNTKHRSLLTLDKNTMTGTIVLAGSKDMRLSGTFREYDIDGNHSMYASPGEIKYALLKKYDALKALYNMIRRSDELVRISFCFFQGRPLDLIVVRLP